MDSTIQGFYGTSWEVRDVNVPEYLVSVHGGSNLTIDTKNVQGRLFYHQWFDCTWKCQLFCKI